MTSPGFHRWSRSNLFGFGLRHSGGDTTAHRVAHRRSHKYLRETRRRPLPAHKRDSCCHCCGRFGYITHPYRQHLEPANNTSGQISPRRHASDRGRFEAGPSAYPDHIANGRNGLCSGDLADFG